MYSNCKEIFKPSQINEILCEGKFIKNNKKLEYLNIPIAFDIETTSFYSFENEKQSTMYAWVFGINGKCIIGRTWDEFLLILHKVKEYYQINLMKRIIIWVHNLAFEFSFIQHYFKWDKVFAIDTRKPVYAVTEDGLEFRCSYILSGYSLDMVGKNLTKYKVEKMVGDLDYSKLRHTKTPLTDKEYGFILNDGLVVMSYIQELLDQYGDFHKLPLTKTGFVRKYVRKECLYGGKSSHKKGCGNAFKKYHNLMKTLIIPNIDTYNQLKRVYTGGFTHCNALYNNVIVDNVTSYDFTSSYPSVMITEKYPMSTPIKVHLNSMQEFNDYLKTHCCMFDIYFYNIEPKLFQDHPISSSKCFYLENATEDNGRVVKASKIGISINEVDFEVIKDFYKWEYAEVMNFRIFEKQYLPTPFIKAVLKLYELKTTLKGSTDLDDLIRYMSSKENLNGCYGMCVTDIIQTNRIYSNGEWVNEEPNIQDTFEKYNTSKSRFLYYPWGVWITSYARRNLFLGIQAVGRDYIYADTDSIKIRNGELYKEWINQYNKWIDSKLKKAMEYHRLDYSMVSPKTIKGVNKTIGYWDYDGFYKRYKTLGAKRYIYEDEDNKMHLTCSGLSKKTINYMLSECKGSNDDTFNYFVNSMYIPKDETGKNIHTYIDYEMKGYLTDYLGNTAYYEELSGVHLEGAEYSLSLSKQYIDYLCGIGNYLR